MMKVLVLLVIAFMLLELGTIIGKLERIEDMLVDMGCTRHER